MERSDFIYARMSAVNPFLRVLPKDDVMQEIQVALLEAPENEQFRYANRNIYRLSTDLGFSRRRGKDAFGGFYVKDSPYVELRDYIDSLTLTGRVDEDPDTRLETIERIYLEGTAQDVCDYFQVSNTNAIRKALHSLFPKGMGLGGVRKGAGRKSKNYENIN